jgi:hypothetical protein
MADADVENLLSGFAPAVRDLAVAARRRVRELLPGAAEEVDAKDRLLGYSFIPGTYKGLVIAIAPQRDYVNLMFATGAQLAANGLDAAGLLEGTGKRARHVKVRSPEVLDDPALRRLIEAAAECTPRDKERSPNPRAAGGARRPSPGRRGTA